jgi:capsular polysaccharide biosynthesis protein
LYGLQTLDIRPLLIFQKTLKPWQIETLDMLGFRDYEYRSIENDFIASGAVFLPSYVGRPGSPHPDGCRWVRERILERTGKNEVSSRIFISRRLATKRRVVNEEELMPIAESFGFDVVEAENLSFTDQVRLFSSAESVVASHGAGLTNLMWVPRGCKVLEILDVDYVNDHFYNLSSVMGLEYFYQLCKSVNAIGGKPVSPGLDHVFVEPAKFERSLGAMFPVR